MSQQSVQLYEAVCAEEWSKVLNLLAQGADPDYHGTQSTITPLMLAAEACEVVVVEQLLQYGCKVDETDWSGQTALLIASKRGFTKVVQILLQHGANIEHTTPRGDTALLVAVSHNHPRVVQLLLENGADIEHRNNANESALFLATSQGFFDLVRLLFEYEAPLEGRLLREAIIRGHCNILRYFLLLAPPTLLRTRKAVSWAFAHKQLECANILTWYIIDHFTSASRS